MKLSDTARAILAAAAEHHAGIAIGPRAVPPAARTAIFRSLVKNSLVTEVNSPPELAGLGWRRDEDGTAILAKITDDGRRAIGIDPNEDDEQGPAAIARRNAERHAAAAQDAPTTRTEGEGATPGEVSPLAAADAPTAPTRAPRTSLRDAATAVLAAWDDEGNRETDIVAALEGPLAALRASLAGKPARPPRTPRAPTAPRTPGKPREGTKQDAVLALLRRDQGATIAEIEQATGWQTHTIRGFFAGLKKRQRIAVERDAPKMGKPSVYRAAAGG